MAFMMHFFSEGGAATVDDLNCGLTEVGDGAFLLAL